MKKFLPFILFLFSVFAAFAQMSLKGLVFESISCDGEGLKPLAGVRISATDAGQVTSRTDGSFTLRFGSKTPGDKVSVFAMKNGYVLTKNAQLVLPKNPEDGTIILIMCSESSFERNSDPTAKLSAEMAKNKRELDKQLQEITEQISKTKKESSEYQELLEEKKGIEDQLKKNEAQIKTLKRAVAKSRNIQIKDKILSNSGVDEMKTLKEKDPVFDDEFIESMIELIWSGYSEEKLDSLRQLGDLEKQRKVMNHYWKGYLFGVDLQFDKAKENYEALIKLVPDNKNYRLIYADLLRIEHKTKEALEQLEIALDLDDDDPALNIEIGSSLAQSYIATNQVEKADQILAKTQKRLKAFSRDTTDYTYKQKLQAEIHSIKGLLYVQKNQYENAINEYSKAKNIHLDLNLTASSTLANIEADIGVAYSKLNQYSKASQSYQIAYAIYEDLVPQDPELYLPMQFQIMFDMGNLFFKQNDFKSAEAVYDEIEKFYNALAQKYPTSTLPNLASIYRAQGAVKHQKKEYYEAIQFKYKEALRIYGDLKKDQPDTYEGSYADVLISMGRANFASKKYKKAKENYYEALVINERLAKKVPAKYEPTLAETYRDIGDYYLGLSVMDSAGYYFNKSLTILEKYSKKNRRLYQLSLLKTKQSYGIYLFRQMNDDEAKKELNEAYLMAKELVEIDSAVYMPDFANAVFENGLVYYNESDLGDAVDKLEEALGIFKLLAKEQKDVYESQIANIYMAIGKIHAFQKDVEAANRAFNSSQRICESKIKDNPDIYNTIISRIYIEKAFLQYNSASYNEAIYNFDIAKDKIIKKGGRLSVEENGLLGEVELHKAQIYIFQKKYNEAQSSLIAARQIYDDLASENEEEVSYKERLAQIEESSGKLNYDLGEFQNALRNFKRSKSNYVALQKIWPKKLAYRTKMCVLNNEIGEAELELKNKQEAEKYFQMVIDTVKKIIKEDPSLKDKFMSEYAMSHFNIGSIYFNDNPDKSLENFRQAEALYIELARDDPKKHLPQLIRSKINVGAIYNNKNMADEAIQIYTGALEEIKKVNYKSTSLLLGTYLKVNDYLGQVNEGLGNYGEARRYFTAILAENSFEHELQEAHFMIRAGVTSIRSDEDEIGEKLLQDAKIIVRRNYSGNPEACKKMMKEICEYIDCE